MVGSAERWLADSDHSFDYAFEGTDSAQIN